MNPKTEAYLSYQPSARNPWGGSGERHRNAKLNRLKVLEIRRLWAEGASAPELADKFGVCATAIYNVVNRKTWGQVG
jgi:hypothetical protein